MSDERNIGLFGAVSVGVGAIVGGGILALAGVAFATTGPSAIVAFALNGVIALLTALSFAELSASFPQSGGTYTFAKRVLSVEAAFAVGWVVWFASIVAAVLYAIGFGYFALVIVDALMEASGWQRAEWLSDRVAANGLAVAAAFGYAISLSVRRGGGGAWANVTKVIVFGLLIAAGLWAMLRQPLDSIQQSLRPFFSAGGLGLIQAMGFTFIALQGFDLIAAVAGQVREPQRNVPRAMLISLGLALCIYLPLLLIVATVGTAPGQTIAQASAVHTETIIAVAAQRFLGGFGYWLVIVAAVLSMMSALRANLNAGSRVAQAMARDRTLPHLLSTTGKAGTPVAAVGLTAVIVGAVVAVLGQVSAAGAASSLIFLLTFMLAHVIAILARRRRGERPPFAAPLFPLVPVVGGLACAALGAFQGFAVPAAGAIVVVWLALGVILFLSLFGRQARIVDAALEALDPTLLRTRGRSPLVLVPIANPANAEAMVEVATALAPPGVGRVMLLSVIVKSDAWRPGDSTQPIDNAQSVLGEALRASLNAGLNPQTLTTVAPQPWLEIGRVARTHRCESMLLGLSELGEEAMGAPIEQLISDVDCDVVILRAPPHWQLSSVQNVLAPIGGRGEHDHLRARLLGSLFRTGGRQVTYLRVLPTNAALKENLAARRQLLRIARDEAADRSDVLVVASDSTVDTIVQHASASDLLVLGLRRTARRRKALGEFVLAVAQRTDTPMLLISRRG